MRKWLFHGLIYLLLAALVVGVVAYALWTNPGAIRSIVQQNITERLVQVSVSIERARLRLLGGILIREMRLARNNGLDRGDFLYVPNAVIYHDKENLLEGHLLVRKVELHRPQIRIVRERDGKLNVAGILGPADLSQPLPSIMIRQGTITFEDRAAGPSPLFEIRDVNVSLINDPRPTLQFDGSGQIDVLGPVRLRGTITRANLAFELHLELPAIVLNRDLARRAATLCPEIGRHVNEVAQSIGGTLGVTADIKSDTDPTHPPRYDVKLHLRDGRIAHKILPMPLEKIDARLHCANGKMPLVSVKAQAGSARLDLCIRDLDIPGSGSPLPELDELGRQMEVSVTDLAVTDRVLECLPPNLLWIKDAYRPQGPINVRFNYRCASPGKRKVQQWLIEPRGMTAVFEGFRYPVHDVRGRIEVDTSQFPRREITLDLAGKGGNSPVALRGTYKGQGERSAVHIDVTGKDILLDNRIRDALPPSAQAIAATFLPEDSRSPGGLARHPMGHADFLAEIRRKEGSTVMNKRYVITFKNCRTKYDQFPYPLENVSGVLDLRPDHWEARGFQGSHKGGKFFVEARSYQIDKPVIPSQSEWIKVSVRARDIPFDHELVQALVPRGGDDRGGLQKTLRTLKLQGRLSCTAEVIEHPGQPQDIDVTVGINGCTIRPDFFPYPMHDVSATVRYARGRIELKRVKARHGQANLGMDSGLIVVGTDGAFTAWLEGITGQGVTPDRDLLRALPEPIRKGLEALAFRTPFDLSLNLTVAAPSGTGVPVKMWWETGLAVKNASFRAGVDLGQVDGGFFCRGHYDGRQLRGLWGDILLERATVLWQPITNVHGRVEVRADSPEVLRFRDLKGDLFGGRIGGEARVEVAPVLKYDVYLDAMNVKLDRFARQNMGETAGGHLSGPVRAAIHLQGEGNDLLGLKGNGRVDVDQGKMGQLPVLLDLMKAFGLRMPDRTAFEEAHLVFALEGPRALVQQLDLYGNAISLRGQGTCDLDGNNLSLEFTTSAGRLGTVLPASLTDISETFSKHLYKIKMRGRLGKDGEFKFDQVPMPSVMEPLWRLVR